MATTLSFHTLYLPCPLAMPRISPNWRITASVLSKDWLNAMTRLKTGDLCTFVGLSRIIATDLNGACTAASAGQSDGRNIPDPFSPFRA